MLINQIVDGRDATIVLSYYAFNSIGNSKTLDELIAKNSD